MATSRKVASKHAKSKDAQPAQPPTRTASGRQRRPTEKENYRVSESQHVTHRQENKEKKLDKQKKKALRAAYEANPDGFEQEPSELHSDIDREEETMFSDRDMPSKLSRFKPKVLTCSSGKIPPVLHNASATHKATTDREEETMFSDRDMPSKLSRFKPKVLTFSSGKIPPVLHNASATHKATTTAPTPSPSASDDSDESTDCGSDSRPEDRTDDEDNNDIAEELSPIARGSKCPLDVTSDDAMVLPKIKKNPDGSRHRMKASDFDDVSKEILVTAISIFRCMVVTQAPFPDNIAVETTLAKAAWHEACQIKGLNVKLTPAGVKMLLTRTSQVRGELKTKMRSLTASFFGFRTSNSNTVIRQNRDLAEYLKVESVFAFKDWESKKGIYKTELLQLGINVMWFANRHDEGVIHHKYFNPMPVEVIALVLTTIECCIDEWVQGLKEDVKFTSATYGTVYHGHFGSLQRFDERTAPYKLLERIRVNLHDTARFHAGVDSLTISSSASRISDTAFEDAIQEYRLEEQHDAEARELRDLTTELHEIIGGLRRHQIPIVSYACDGTKVERAVQRIVVRDADSVIVYGIESPFAGMSAIRLEIPVHHGQALVNIQDPKHGLKTFRNNLFSGARLLILGNYTALFAHIRAMAFEDGTPLYHRDVEKLDRQDDNAAARLFSSATLKFLVEHHPDHVGEIVFLFIHGEIVDAYQHRSISHCERVKMVLRARYFYDGWRLYLAKIGYKENKYFMSRESTDIVMRLIDGLISLVIVYHDYLPDDHPLLPWLHTSEPCEHSFANLRNIKKDFVMLDAYYAIPKLHAKLQEEVLRQRSPNFKARAQGYTITYFYDHTVDIPELSQYPSDTDIQEASQDAAHEAQSLLALCGISPGLLMQTQSIVLPSIVHFDGGMDISDSDNGGDESENESVVDRDADAEEQCEAQLLDTLMKLAEDDDISRTEKQRNKLLQLTFAAIALDTDEQQCIRKFAEDEDEDDTEICAHEFAQIEHCLSLPAVRLADNLSKPMGLGTFPIQALDIDALVRIRSNHETEQAKKGIRTGRAQLNDIAGNVLSERRRLIREFQVVLKEQQGRAIGTGLERAARWTEQVPQAGNSANAANAAKAVVKRAMLRRKSVFKTARLPLLAILNDARITLLRPLKDGDFGIVFTEQWGLRVGRVVAIYSKGGGKNGKHGAVESVDAIAAISYLGVQLYQQHFRQYFRSLPDATSIFQCRQFAFLPSTAFLCLLTSAPKVTPSGLELVPADVSAFETLHHASPRLTEAAKLFRKRVVNQTVLQGDHDEGEEEY
ncbi:hypothetical protein DEU56DRAFT_899942 [Suillus clintonianus]|uniref:uncharacterized protein n=1 Tax=Suillus clintonianus TaxID=1904413 RepID=UPI001B8843F9|nr:uncharacterized protein DEU56DRAFT_899942 [Suillus clintonianus]KAG2145165.1 hypothetical protein DEU56DRAFT_899942 [Suillus clintonianus]